MRNVGVTRRLFPALALLLTLGSTPARSAASTQAPSTATTPSTDQSASKPATKAPASIPVPEVARRAEEVTRLLREVDALLAPSPVIASIEARWPKITARIASDLEVTNGRLENHASAPLVDTLTAQWQETRAEMGTYVNILAERATALEVEISRLTTLEETWTRARGDARTSRAPGQVVERINSVLAAVAVSRVRLQEARAATLVSQDRFAQEVARCEGILERIAKVRQDPTARLLDRDGVPLWQAEEFAVALRDMTELIGRAVATEAAEIRHFARDQRRGIAFHVALFFGLVLVMYAARREVFSRTSTGVRSDRVAVFDRPVSAAGVIALLLSSWIYSPRPPRAALALGAVLVLIPALRVTRRLVDPRLVGALYALGALCLVDVIHHFAALVPLLEQQIFLLEMLTGLAVAAWWLRSRQWRGDVPREGLAVADPGLRITGWVALVSFTAALVAAVAGYMNLALLLGAVIPGTGYLALVLHAAVRIADGLIAVAMRVRPLSHLAMVQRHRQHLEQRAHGVLRVLAVAAWTVFALRYFGLGGVAKDVAASTLGAELRLGSLGISFGDVLVFSLTVAAAFVISGVVRFVLEEEVFSRFSVGRAVAYAVSNLLHYALLVGGFVLALGALGADLTKVTILAGAFGVGIGFGLQGIVNNLVSGLVILFERRIDVGDAVQVGDVFGMVQHIGVRACVVRTPEGAEVIVPNANLVSERVVNWTLSDHLRRVDLSVGVAHGTPVEKVVDILLGVARAHPCVLLAPEPIVLFQGFGDSALRFLLQVWTDRFELWVKTQSDLAVAVNEALREAGIDMPFPQHDIHIRR